MSELRLKDKVALITGAGDYFGEAVAIAYAREGADLYLHDFAENADALERVAEAMREHGGKVVTGLYDLTREPPVKAMAADAIEKFGRVDILVNTTAGGWHGKLWDCTEEDWDKALDRGLKAYFLTCKHVGKEMARRAQGKVINLTSIVGEKGSGGAIPWGAARGGVDSMTYAMAQYLGQYGINVVGLARGASTSSNYAGRAKAERVMRLPFGRIGTQEDLMGPAVFLATDDSDWVTGSILYADGGYVTGGVSNEWRTGQKTYDGP